MAFAPFGDSRQPLFGTKIVGGRQVEVMLGPPPAQSQPGAAEPSLGGPQGLGQARDAFGGPSLAVPALPPLTTAPHADSPQVRVLRRAIGTSLDQ